MAAVATALACGCRPDVGEDAVPRIRSVAVSHPVAYSASETMAVLDDGGVCLLDTYSVRILCGDARWSVVTEIGREGKGPGEISGTGELLPIPGGGLAYVDNRNRRIAIYSAALEFSHDVAKEEMGPPIPPIAEDSVLYVMQTSFARTERTINRYSLGEREPPPPIRLVLDASAIGLDSIAAAPILRTDDSFLLRATGDNLILMAADGDRVLGVMSSLHRHSIRATPIRSISRRSGQTSGTSSALSSKGMSKRSPAGHGIITPGAQSHSSTVTDTSGY